MLKIGNHLNVGTARGNAHGFNMDTLLKVRIFFFPKKKRPSNYHFHGSIVTDKPFFFLLLPKYVADRHKTVRSLCNRHANSHPLLGTTH